ncbi:MAG: histidine phosphatase family protein [Phormidesmis sp.]
MMLTILTGNPILRRWLWGSLCLSVLIAGCTSTQSPAQIEKTEQPSSAVVEPAPEPSEPPPTPAASAKTAENMLWEKLAQANEETYVVLLRHALAPGTGDPANFQLNDCSTQRNLSETGREQAIAIGEAFRSRNTPVIEILSSQWCRCLETAELMAVGPVEPFPALNSFFRDRSTANDQHF